MNSSFNGNLKKQLDLIERSIRPPKVEIEQDGDAIVIKWDNKPVKKLLKRFFDAL